MKTFKAGDKVQVVKCTRDHWWYADKTGETYTLDAPFDPSMTRWYVKGRKYTWLSVEDIQLVAEEPSPLTTFLKTQPWFIRTGTPEKSEAVQKWLFGNGLSWNSGCNSVIPSLGEGFLSSCKASRFWSDDYAPAGVEITLEFETVVKSFKLPEVKTQQEKLIEELEETIKKAQQQIEGLKNK